MNPWAPIIIPGAIGAAVAGIGHLIAFGRFEQKQDEHERRLVVLEDGRVTKDEIKGLRELMEARFEGLQQLVTVRLDAMTTMMQAGIERRVAQAPIEGERRVS